MMSNSQASSIRLSEKLMQRLDDFLQFESIDSTNAEATRLLDSGKSGTFLVLAHAQSAGRGRRGRQWLSPAGAGVYLSLVRPFALPANTLQALSLVTALAVHAGLQHCGVNNLQLKWPNDLLSSKKKLGGILLELKRTNEENYIVFGVGINLRLSQAQREAIGQPVTDLATVLDREADPELLLNHVVGSLLELIDQFERESFAPLQSRWNSLDCYLDQDIVLQIGDQRKIGKSMGVDVNGALLLQTAAGLEAISGGEIFPSLRPVANETST